jgi:hypothetical protein
VIWHADCLRVRLFYRGFTLEFAGFWVAQAVWVSNVPRFHILSVAADHPQLYLSSLCFPVGSIPRIKTRMFSSLGFRV